MVEGIVFDLDGTLLESMYLWTDICSRTVEAMGYETYPEINHEVTVMSLRQACEYMKKVFSMKESAETVFNNITDQIMDAYRYEVLPKPGVTDMLEEFSGRGIPMCIATASERPPVEAALIRLDMMKYFVEVCTCTEVGLSKSNPGIYRILGKKMGAKKEKTIVFEDAFHSAETAKKDGFRLAGVYDDFEPNKEALVKLSDIYIEDFRDMDRIRDFAYNL